MAKSTKQGPSQNYLTPEKMGKHMGKKYDQWAIQLLLR